MLSPSEPGGSLGSGLAWVPCHLEPVAAAGCAISTAGPRVEETPRNIQEEGETAAASGHPGKGDLHALSSRPLLKLHIPVIFPSQWSLWGSHS